jgi:hypothetical protein
VVAALADRERPVRDPPLLCELLEAHDRTADFGPCVRSAGDDDDRRVRGARKLSADLAERPQRRLVLRGERFVGRFRDVEPERRERERHEQRG